MKINIFKLLALILLVALAGWSCDRQTESHRLVASNASPIQRVEAGDRSFLESLQLQNDFSLPDSEVPLLSVKLLNYLAHQAGKTPVCEGETNEFIGLLYFPNIYQLNSQEYLVEQTCSIAYNIRYSYFIYRSEISLDEAEAQPLSWNTYDRTQDGYFALRDSLNQPIELTLPAGNVIALTFDQYSVNELGKSIRFISYVISGRRIYDSTQRILAIFSRARGTADCGDFARYQLQEMGFRLIEYRHQECCYSQQECSDSSYSRSPDRYPQIYP